MQPQPQQISTFKRRLTGGYFKTPNYILENADALTSAEYLFLSIIFRRGPGCTVSDKTWQDWTGLSSRMKDHAIMGLKKKGLQTKGEGKAATYNLDERRYQGWVSSHTAREKARTAGRSKSVTAKAGMQVHPECQERGCSKLCEAKIIPFPEKPVSQNSPQVEETTEKQFPKSPPHPPPKTFPLTLAAIQTYFPHADEAFVRKLCTAVGEKKHFTDAQLAQVVHAAKKRNQESEGLFLLTVPARYAAGISTEWNLTHEQRRELRQAQEILANPKEWPPDAIEQAKGILKKYAP
jgi:hypothetical protein